MVAEGDNQFLHFTWAYLRSQGAFTQGTFNSAFHVVAQSPNLLTLNAAAPALLDASWNATRLLPRGTHASRVRGGW